MKTTTSKSVKTKKVSVVDMPLLDQKGKETKRIPLPSVIAEAEANPRLIAQYIHVYLANQRQGTASTKTRSEVRASSRKIYRQKGTGNARHGALSAPIFVGGGVAGGPKPRDYELKLNKKQKRKTLLAALHIKAAEQSFYGLISEIMKMKPQTKSLITLLKTAGLDNKNVLIVLPDMHDTGLLLSVRNIPNVSTSDVFSLNPYMILNHDALIFIEEALPLLEKHFVKTYAN